MKRTLAALCFIIFLIALCLIYYLGTDRALGQCMVSSELALEYLTQKSYPAALFHLKELEKSYLRVQPLLFMFACDENPFKAQYLIEKAIDGAEKKDASSVVSALDELREVITALKSKEGIDSKRIA